MSESLPGLVRFLCVNRDSSRQLTHPFVTITRAPSSIKTALDSPRLGGGQGVETVYFHLFFFCSFCSPFSSSSFTSPTSRTRIPIVHTREALLSSLLLFSLSFFPSSFSTLVFVPRSRLITRCRFRIGATNIDLTKGNKVNRSKINDFLFANRVKFFFASSASSWIKKETSNFDTRLSLEVYNLKFIKKNPIFEFDLKEHSMYLRSISMRYLIPSILFLYSSQRGYFYKIFSSIYSSNILHTSNSLKLNIYNLIYPKINIDRQSHIIRFLRPFNRSINPSPLLSTLFRFFG